MLLFPSPLLFDFQFPLPLLLCLLVSPPPLFLNLLLPRLLLFPSPLLFLLSFHFDLLQSPFFGFLLLLLHSLGETLQFSFIFPLRQPLSSHLLQPLHPTLHARLMLLLLSFPERLHVIVDISLHPHQSLFCLHTSLVLFHALLNSFFFGFNPQIFIFHFLFTDVLLKKGNFNFALGSFKVIDLFLLRFSAVVDFFLFFFFQHNLLVHHILRVEVIFHNIIGLNIFEQLLP